jgi:hypothetical protein
MTAATAFPGGNLQPQQGNRTAVFGTDFKLGINYTWNSGQPDRIPERTFFDGEDFQLIYSYKDRVRLPEYLRLDLSTKYEIVRRWGSIEPYLEVIMY